MEYPITGDEVMKKLQRLANAGYNTCYVVFGDAHGWKQCDVHPQEPVNRFCSWRGSYALPTCYSGDATRLTVLEILEKMKEFYGSVQTGYKGGEWVMYSNDPLWADEYGRAGEKGVIDVIEKDGFVVFVRAQCEY